nr:hypothetical protein [Tanacetum cinerariifolium]
MGHGSGQGSVHGSTYSLAPVNDDEEDDSPVEEVSPVKPKKPSRRAARAKKNDPKVPLKDWIVVKEIALCQAWCDVSENNIVGNSMKTMGFWDAVITYFENETGAKKSKTSETTSGSASVGFNLNDEADESVEETQDLRLMGCDQSKAMKKSVGSSRQGSSLFVDFVADKFLNIKKIGKEGRATTVLYRVEESGGEYPGSQGS